MVFEMRSDLDHSDRLEVRKSQCILVKLWLTWDFSEPDSENPKGKIPIKS